MFNLVNQVTVALCKERKERLSWNSSLLLGILAVTGDTISSLQN